MVCMLRPYSAAALSVVHCSGTLRGERVQDILCAAADVSLSRSIPSSLLRIQQWRVMEYWVQIFLTMPFATNIKNHCGRIFFVLVLGEWWTTHPAVMVIACTLRLTDWWTVHGCTVYGRTVQSVSHYCILSVSFSYWCNRLGAWRHNSWSASLWWSKVQVDF